MNASSWFYYKNLSRCMVTWTSNTFLHILVLYKHKLYNIDLLRNKEIILVVQLNPLSQVIRNKHLLSWSNLIFKHSCTYRILKTLIHKSLTLFVCLASECIIKTASIQTETESGKFQLINKISRKSSLL